MTRTTPEEVKIKIGCWGCLSSTVAIILTLYILFHISEIVALLDNLLKG